MFQAEMENLELGSILGQSDQLFADDLLNIPLENVIEDSNVYGDFHNVLDKEVPEVSDDILERIIQEVKLPFEEEPMQLVEDSLFDIDDRAELPDSPNTSSDDSCDTQTLIDEMEEFLLRHEEMKTQRTAPKVTKQETLNAEKILDALMTGGITANDNNSNDDSGFFDMASINNVSEIVTADGQKIVIVITNDLEKETNTPLRAAPSPALSSSSSGVFDQDSSDSDWSPSPVESPKRRGVKRGRPAKADLEIPPPRSRGPYKKRGRLDVTDKKERKKLQNVVAARRYRDKKKNEQNTIESEEQQLADKNKALREKLSEMESEFKTLKKLMVELGLVNIKTS